MSDDLGVVGHWNGHHPGIEAEPLITAPANENLPPLEA